MRERLIKMLLDKGLAEERAGYGHATAEDVADAVIEFLESEEEPDEHRFAAGPDYEGKRITW